MLRAARPCLGGQGQLRGLCSAAKDKSRRKVDWKPSDAYRSSATVSARAAKRLEVGLEAEAAAPAGIRRRALLGRAVIPADAAEPVTSHVAQPQPVFLDQQSQVAFVAAHGSATAQFRARRKLLRVDGAPPAAAPAHAAAAAAYKGAARERLATGTPDGTIEGGGGGSSGGGGGGVAGLVFPVAVALVAAAAFVYSTQTYGVSSGADEAVNRRRTADSA
eukprot:TRINITY_DN1706_c0_g1_i1.p1 TRINITY_DN1706_c0_g1~~TRINITY_DN1706_c0_g1_i1.p1  ORF type:complete len:234 (+),score=55.55 TRINITY_DN1706_c0_g1_i1:47-703(+)